MSFADTTTAWVLDPWDIFGRDGCFTFTIKTIILFQEEEELIEEWQPEPLVPATPTYDLDVITPKVVEG